MQALNRTIDKKWLVFLFLASFLVRAVTFHFFIAPQERYKQPDSRDYHNCAISLFVGTCMHRADTLEPIFWRTPGYPAYLAIFYKLFGIESSAFSGARIAHIMALWLQILLSSLIPIILFFLVLQLTGIPLISWITAWIYALHFGPILASCFLLTEAIAIIFFSLFLFYFYRQLKTWGEVKQKKAWAISISLAAISLGIATWLRPMGEFVLVVAAVLIFVLDRVDWKTKFKKVGLLCLVFFAVTGPWYLRNYKLTEKFFFCPMFGPYLNSFCAPKILRDTNNIPLKKCIQLFYNLGQQEARKDQLAAFAAGKQCCPLFGPLRAALPIIKKHPFLFFRNWMVEVFKTTFDLYANQLVALTNNSFSYDPLEEFLTEKWADCLYKQKIPLLMRLLVFLEVLFELLKWIGLLCGAWLFLLAPLFKPLRISEQQKKIGALWLKTAPMIGAFIFMTGGFGYARLRLPVEPLMIMLSLTSYYFLLKKKTEKNV